MPDQSGPVVSLAFLSANNSGKTILKTLPASPGFLALIIRYAFCLVTPCRINSCTNGVFFVFFMLQYTANVYTVYSLTNLCLYHTVIKRSRHTPIQSIFALYSPLQSISVCALQSNFPRLYHALQSNFYP